MEKRATHMVRFRAAARRVLCLLFALAVLIPAPTGAAQIAIFTAANEKLYPLSDETMPFWSDGTLYVPQTALTDNSLDIFYNRNREKQKISLYQLHSGLVFDLETGYADASSGLRFYAPLIFRGDLVFFPLDALCPFFGLEYSYTRVTYGYLLRIRNSAARLTDLQYIDAAASAMATRYEQYSRAHADPVLPDTPAPAPVPQPDAVQERTVYLAVEATDESYADALLEALPGGSAAFLFAPQSIPGLAPLLRRLASGEGTVALRIDGSGGAEDALRRIEAGNRALWSAANVKTLLVRLDGADDATLAAVAEAGYCPLRFAADYGESYPSVSRMSARIFAAADGAGGSCRVFLGTDEGLSRILPSLLSSLRAGNCTPARLSEVTAR